VYGNGSSKDYFDNIWGKREEYASEQEHIDFIKENDIRSGNQYRKVYKSSNLKLHSTPWREYAYGNESSKDYFESIWGKKEECASEQEHIDFIKENDIRSGNQYRKVYKSSNLKLHSNPWREYVYGNGSSKDYFDSIWGNVEYASEQEHIDFIKENDIRSANQYAKKYKSSKLNLHSSPWVENVYGNGSSKDYFDNIWGKREEYASEQEHIDFIKENDIRSGNQYAKKYKSSKLNLHSSPWREHIYGNGKQKDYFDSIWGAQYVTEQEHINFIKENNIKISKKYTELYKTIGMNLYTFPWIKFGNGSSKDYFKEIWGSCGQFVTEQEHIDFIKENDIRSGRVYKNSYKKSKLKLYSKPWRNFGNGKPKDYFDNIWTEKEKIKRDYSPAYLGEFSEMNKKWNTSNSNTTHQKLKEDKSEWIKYHKLYSKSRETWNEIPYKEIAKKINVRPDWIIGDFGCGENLLSKEIKNKVYAFDHIAIDDNVIACDMTNVPLENNFLDVAVFSLSLMGSNYKEYLKEAHRVLKPMGILYISEPYKRWEDKIDQLKNTLSEIGFKMIDDVEHNYKFIYIRLIK
jgi:SAM-dependent methyltransferase